jgi:hypothetical protein
MLPETPLAFHERILQACTSQLSVGGYDFEFVIGDLFEINNESDDVIKPVVCLEQESLFNIDNDTYDLEKMTIGILFLSKLDDTSNQRTNYYNLAKMAVKQLKSLLDRIRITSQGELVFNAMNGSNLGKKILLGFSFGNMPRVKNKYSSNRDGCMIPNLELKIIDNFNYCTLTN